MRSSIGFTVAFMRYLLLASQIRHGLVKAFARQLEGYP
jgi:hypothetical protein